MLVDAGTFLMLKASSTMKWQASLGSQSHISLAHSHDSFSNQANRRIQSGLTIGKQSTSLST